MSTCGGGGDDDDDMMMMMMMACNMSTCGGDDGDDDDDDDDGLQYVNRSQPRIPTSHLTDQIFGAAAFYLPFYIGPWLGVGPLVKMSGFYRPSYNRTKYRRTYLVKSCSCLICRVFDPTKGHIDSQLATWP